VHIILIPAATAAAAAAASQQVLQDDTPAAPAPKREIILPGGTLTQQQQQQWNTAAAAAAAAGKLACLRMRQQLLQCNGEHMVVVWKDMQQGEELHCRETISACQAIAAAAVAHRRTNSR
jgi:hypothetical protein